MRLLTEKNIEDIALGAAVLGTGGGGDPYIGMLMARQAIRAGIDAGKSLDELKKSLDLPWYKKWTGLDVKERTENIEHVYGELTDRKTKNGS